MADGCRERLKQAERLWQDGTHDKRALAVEMARNVERQCRETVWAEEARIRLQEWLIIREPYQNDLELDAYSLKWQAVQSLFDGQLVTFFDGIKRNSSIAARMRRVIIKDLRRWVEEATMLVNNGLKPDSLNAIHRSMNAISTMDTYTVDLADELNHLQRALFVIAYEKAKPEIRQALDEWHIDAAMNLWKQLCTLASEFQTEVAALQQEIYRVDKLRQAVQDFLCESAGEEPRDWLQLRRLINSLARLLDFHDEKPIPVSSRQRLIQLGNQSMASAQTFFMKQAAAAGNLIQMRDFWAEYECLNIPALGSKLARIPALESHLDPQEDWFSPCLELVIRQMSVVVAQATGPEDLKNMAIALEQEKDDLPPIVAAIVDAMAKDIGKLAIHWESMNTGSDFDTAKAHLRKLAWPERFLEATPRFQELLAKINEACKRIQAGDPSPSRQDYLDAAQVAQNILSEMPNHQRASRLKSEAEQGILRLNLDEALLTWHIDIFLELCRSAKVEEIYAEIASYKGVLYRLAFQAEQKQFSRSSKAAEWWSQWHVLKDQLPPSKPKSLKQAILTQEAIHRELWYGLLEKLRDPELSPHLTPEECLAIAGSLKNESLALSLEGYEIEFTRRATVGLIDRYIAAQDYQRAEEEINQLKKHHPDTRRLQTRLKIGRARLAGASAVIEIFSREWSNVIAHLDHPYDLLLEVIQEAWETDAPELLEALKTLTDLALLPGEPASPQIEPLRQWREWLKIEFDLRFKFSEHSVKQLADYLKGADPQDAGFRKRVERLINLWKKQRDTVMLAWAYQAFNHLDSTLMPPARDPREDMGEGNEQAARRVLRTLETTAALQKSDLEAMLNDLNHEQRKWVELDYYFGLLDFKPKGCQPPSLFTKTRRRLENLIEKVTLLERLDDSDLRQEAAQVESLGRSLENEFQDFALQQPLTQRLERLVPLTRMNHLLEQLKDAAKECGKDANTNNLNCFPQVKGLLDEIIQVFTAAQALEGKMWWVVSEEYCNMIYMEASIYLPKPRPADLRELASRIEVLVKQELELKSAIDVLWRERPPIPINGSFKREHYGEYVEYLKLLSREEPGAKKIYERFRRFAVDRIPTILQQCRADLPKWVGDYLDERVASCSDE